MNTLAKLRELAAVRSILHDAIEERFGQCHDHAWLSLPVTDRIGVLSLEFNTLADELVGDLKWRSRSTLAKSMNIHVHVVGSDPRLRHRRTRHRFEASYMLNVGQNADIRSTSMTRGMFDRLATEQIDLEDRLEAQMFQALASTHLPYTDDGIALIESSVRNTLEARGLINVNVSAADNGDRQVDVVYAVTMPNAIRNVTISGKVEL